MPTFQERVADVRTVIMLARDEVNLCDQVEMAGEALLAALKLHGNARDETADVQRFWTVEVRPKYPRCTSVHLDCWDRHGGAISDDPIHSYTLNVGGALRTAESMIRTSDVVDAAETTRDRSKP
jgi:hypothetical protein